MFGESGRVWWSAFEILGNVGLVFGCMSGLEYELEEKDHGTL